MVGLLFDHMVLRGIVQYCIVYSIVWYIMVLRSIDTGVGPSEDLKKFSAFPWRTPVFWKSRKMNGVKVIG